MKRKLLVHLAVALCLAGVANAQETTIGVYMDAAGTTCSGATTGGVLQGSIWANLAGQGAAGITTAEFRVDVDAINRTNLNLQFVPDPSLAIVIGNPFDMIGVSMAWSACTTGTNSRILLGTFTVLETSPVVNAEFTLRKKYTPANPILDCAMVTLCDAPVYTAICVAPADSDHWRAVLNSDGGVTADCTPVAVTASTWTQVKEIFRN